jgi:hypothetical protein
MGLGWAPISFGYVAPRVAVYAPDWELETARARLRELQGR